MQAYQNRIGSFQCQGTRRYPNMSVNELLSALLPDPSAEPPCLDTPYSQYSNTNYAVSGEDICAVNEIVCQRQEQLRDITTDIVRVEAILQRVRTVQRQLLDTRDQITASMAAHQGFMSRIRRLPSEILGEIFVQCLPPETHVEPDVRAAPLLLLRICRGWRKVALKTPRLWCSLSVRPSERVQRQGLFVYHHWLSRAKGCPLALAIDTRHVPENPVWQFEVTELLQQYASRSARLRLTFDEVTAPELLLKDVPILEHLTLLGGLSVAPNIAIVQPQPRLYSLTLNLSGLHRNLLSSFDAGWTRLTRLHVMLDPAPSDDVHGPVVLMLLALCPNLQEFSFAPVFATRNDVATYAAHAMTHTRLRSLDIVVTHGAGCLFDVLTLPSLRHLQVRDLDIIPSAWRHNELRSFLTRSRCPLETLKICGAQVSIMKEDRAEYTALVPTLKHLDLDLCPDVMPV